MWEQACPILPSRDFDRTQAFYGTLGFQTWYRDEGYLLINRDGVELHFFHHPSLDADHATHGAYIRPADVDAVSDEIAALGLPDTGSGPKFAPAEDKPWGMREASLWDPDGNLFRIGQEVRTNG